MEDRPEFLLARHDRRLKMIGETRRCHAAYERELTAIREDRLVVLRPLTDRENPAAALNNAVLDFIRAAEAGHLTPLDFESTRGTTAVLLLHLGEAERRISREISASPRLPSEAQP